MNLFKDDYNQLFRSVTPSPELDQETLDLMMEAQDHGLHLPPKPKSKKPLILSLSLSGAAAVLAIVIGLSFLLHRPEVVGPDEVGNLQSVISGGSSSSSDKNELFLSPEDEDVKGESTPEQSEDEANPPAQENGAQPPADDATDEEEQGENESTEENTNSSPVSPLAPVVINDKTTETYLSIQSYLDALVAKKTIGYNKNYMAQPALVIVPSYLPQKVQFRHFYAKSNGGYSYSYLLTDGNNQYFLDISAAATFPRTLRDLNLRVRSIKGEYEGLDKADNKRIYYFGNFEEVTVTLTTVNGAPTTLEETDRLLADLQMDRYTEQNTLVQLTYE